MQEKIQAFHDSVSALLDEMPAEDVVEHLSDAWEVCFQHLAPATKEQFTNGLNDLGVEIELPEFTN